MRIGTDKIRGGEKREEKRADGTRKNVRSTLNVLVNRRVFLEKTNRKKKKEEKKE